MINPIQNTTNYQPNFGMAIRRDASEKVLRELGNNIDELRMFEALTRKAANNKSVSVGLARGSIDGLVLIDQGNVKIPDSFIPKKDTWLKTVIKGVDEALKKNPPLPKIEKGTANEAGLLRENIRALSTNGDYYDYISQMR